MTWEENSNYQTLNLVKHFNLSIFQASLLDIVSNFSFQTFNLSNFQELSREHVRRFIEDLEHSGICWGRCCHSYVNLNVSPSVLFPVCYPCLVLRKLYADSSFLVAWQTSQTITQNWHWFLCLRMSCLCWLKLGVCWGDLASRVFAISDWLSLLIVSSVHVISWHMQSVQWSMPGIDRWGEDQFFAIAARLSLLFFVLSISPNMVSRLWFAIF